MTFGERLQTAIDARGSSRKAVARAVGVTVQALGQVVRGDTKAFTSENTAKAAKCLGISSHWLATGEGKMVEEGAPETHGTSLSPPTGLLAALTEITAAFQQADPLTAAQVRPLFSMLFGTAGDAVVDPGTITQRIAELLAARPDLKLQNQESQPQRSPVDIVINKEEEKENGASDRAAANERKAGGS